MEALRLWPYHGGPDAAAILTAAFLIALSLSAILTFWVIQCGPVDRPRERGAHINPTPTSGGMAMIAATAMAVGVSIMFAGLIPLDRLKPGLWLFVFAASMGISGAADDVLGISPRLKFALQVLAALIFAARFPALDLDFGLGLNLHLWWPIGWLGSALWLVAVLNTVNFMDGANGLAAGAQSLAILMLMALLISWMPTAGLKLDILASGTGIVLLSAFAAHLGFTPFNLPMGKVFQGDAGSLFGAAIISGAVLIAHYYGLCSVWFGGYILAPILTDTILTMTLRARRGEKLFEAHKMHLYQQWLDKRHPSHGRLSLIVWGLSLVTGILGLIMEYVARVKGIDLRFIELMVVIATLSVGWFRLRRRLAPQAVP